MCIDGSTSIPSENVDSYREQDFQRERLFCIHCRSATVFREHGEDRAWLFCPDCDTYSRIADMRATAAFDEHLDTHRDLLADWNKLPITRSGGSYWCEVCGTCIYSGEGPVLDQEGM